MITGFQAGVMGIYGGLWTPANITTVVWLDASDNSTITLVDNKVSQWADKSGGSCHANQTNVGYRPSASSGSILLIYPSFLRISDTVNLQFGTADFVICVVGAVDVSDRGTNAQNTFVSKDYTGYELFNYVGGLKAYVGGTANSPISGVPSNILSLMAVNRISGVLTTRLNGTASLPVTNTTNVSKIGTDLYIGVRPVLYPQLFMLGSISEVVIAAHSVEKIEGYLAHKWGLTTSLPSGHPYRYSPPTV